MSIQNNCNKNDFEKKLRDPKRKIKAKKKEPKFHNVIENSITKLHHDIIQKFASNDEQTNQHTRMTKHICNDIDGTE